MYLGQVIEVYFCEASFVWARTNRLAGLGLAVSTQSVQVFHVPFRLLTWHPPFFLTGAHSRGQCKTDIFSTKIGKLQ
jgi:hypothetical protein